MKWFLFGISVLWVISGTVILFNTEIIRRNFFQRLRQTNPKKLSPIPILLGVLLALSAAASSQKIVIYVLAGMAVLKGIFYLAAPPVKVTRLINWFLSGSNKIYMGIGALIAILGIYVLGTMIA